jgi:hypothetical protein
MPVRRMRVEKKSPNNLRARTDPRSGDIPQVAPRSFLAPRGVSQADGFSTRPCITP